MEVPISPDMHKDYLERKEAGQWEMRPNALLLCLFGTNCNIFLIATFRFIGNSHF